MENGSTPLSVLVEAPEVLETLPCLAVLVLVNTSGVVKVLVTSAFNAIIALGRPLLALEMLFSVRITRQHLCDLLFTTDRLRTTTFVSSMYDDALLDENSEVKYTVDVSCHEKAAVLDAQSIGDAVRQRTYMFAVRIIATSVVAAGGVQRLQMITIIARGALFAFLNNWRTTNILVMHWDATFRGL